MIVRFQFCIVCKCSCSDQPITWFLVKNNFEISRVGDFEISQLGGGVDEEEFTIQRSSDYLCTFREVMQAYSANALSRMKYAGHQDIRECLLSCADDIGAWSKVTKYVS